MKLWYVVLVPLTGGEFTFEVCRCDSPESLSECVRVLAPRLLRSHTWIKVVCVVEDETCPTSV